MKRTNKRKWIQPARILVQLIFFGICLLGIVSSKQVSDWLLPTTLLVGVLFCGWICPLGTLQDWAYKLGRKLKLPLFRMPYKVQRYLQLSRYILYFLLTLGVTFTVLQGTKNLSALMKGKEIALASLIVLIIFVLVGIFFNRPFCNYICTGGARRGLWSVIRIIGIRRDTSRCINCKLCSKSCPMNIDVANTDFVRHPNCIGCMSCLSACPKNCISFRHSPKPNLPGKAGKPLLTLNERKV
jgi:polyferredoxin